MIRRKYSKEREKGMFGVGFAVLGRVVSKGFPAAAAAKLLQSCSTLCDPTDGSPQAPPSRDSPGKNTGVGCHFLP